VGIRRDVLAPVPSFLSKIQEKQEKEPEPEQRSKPEPPTFGGKKTGQANFFTKTGNEKVNAFC
jgi:hypothetical protein